MSRQAERDVEDRAFSEQPYHLDTDLNSVPTGWPSTSPPLDEYDEPVPADIVALFATREKR